MKKPLALGRNEIRRDCKDLTGIFLVKYFRSGVVLILRHKCKRLKSSSPI